MAWGRDTSQQSVFENVLNVSRSFQRVPGHRRKAITIDFSLCRSIASRVLWDVRSGGIMMNEGYMRVVPRGPPLADHLPQGAAVQRPDTVQRGERVDRLRPDAQLPRPGGTGLVGGD